MLYQRIEVDYYGLELEIIVNPYAKNPNTIFLVPTSELEKHFGVSTNIKSLLKPKRVRIFRVPNPGRVSRQNAVPLVDFVLAICALAAQGNPTAKQFVERNIREVLTNTPKL